MNNCGKAARRREEQKAQEVKGPAGAAVTASNPNLLSLSGPVFPDFALRRENEAVVDLVFKSLLSDANKELAGLLHDVYMGSMQNGMRCHSVGELLMRAVRCAAKQYMLQAELGNLALLDELTGLYNRRGFHALADRQLKLGCRSGRGMLLFFLDVDGLKNINDGFGHREGDLALQRTVAILKRTFRDSDIIARLGGDEFAVLAIEASGRNETSIKARLFEGLSSINAKQGGRYQISLSVGAVRFDCKSLASVEELMEQADRAMYEQKRNRREVRLLA